MEKNQTSGSVFQTILQFSIPYLFSYFLQTLYGMADLYMVGRYSGVNHITAVSIGSQVMHMLTVMIVGLAMGATVTIAKAVGAKKEKEASLAIGNTAVLFLGLSIGFTAALLFLVNPITAIMATPTEAVLGTASYLTICFLGIPFITAYNIISSIFRGLGDSKSPMYFVAAACVSNILLDYIFIRYFSLGATGAALGTVISQTLSVVFALFVILKHSAGIKLQKADFKPSPITLKRILKIGVPVALQDTFIQVAFIVITIIANRRGLVDAAAVGIVEKIIGVVFLVPSTMLSAVSALSAQNIGAKKEGRARLTLRYAIFITVGFGIAMSVFVQSAYGQLVGIFTEDSDVILSGGQYLRSYIWDCVFAGIHFSFSGYFYACGKSGISFLHNILSIVLIRIPGAYFASEYFAASLFPMGLAAPAGSLLSVAVCAAAYLKIRNSEEKT